MLRIGTPIGLAAFALALLAPAARADVLLLAGGGRVEGVVTEKGDTFVVESVAATATIPKSDVKARIVAPYITEIYAKRLACIDLEDPDARFELARWCKEKGLRKRAHANLLAVIRLDPDHAGARAELGQVEYRGEWMSPEAAEAARRKDAGFVRYRDHWYTPDGLEALLRIRQEAAKLRVEAGKRAAAREEQERLRREAEEKQARAVAEKRAREAALARAEDDRRERERLERENQELRELLRDLARRGSYDGYGWYVSPGWYLPGYAPAGTFGRSRGLSPRSSRWGAGLDFRWTGDHFRVRGTVR